MIGNYTLITNLEWAVVNGIRTFTHALLVSDHEGAFDKNTRRRQLRGFGTDPAWPVFDLDIPSTSYTLSDARSGNVMILSGNDPKPRPLCSGAIMQIESGPRVDLLVSDQRRPLDVRTFPREVTIRDVWDVLPGLVRSYWTAPNMPTLQWGPR